MPGISFPRELARFLLGTPCLCCRQRSSSGLCPACCQELRHSLQGQRLTLQGLPIFVLGPYEGVLRQTLQGLKYHKASELGWWLGVELGKSWQQQHRPHQRYSVIPIPIHGDRQQQRGYNQAQLLAAGFCRVTGDRLVSDLLVRAQSTVPLYRLSRQERQQAMQGVFEVRTDRPLGTVAPALLVDDILTTGATLIEARRTLQRQGIRCVGAVVLALTPDLQAQRQHFQKPAIRKSVADRDR